MNTYGNNAIVAEYDYYTLDQAEKILKEKEHKQKQKDREENISAIVTTLLAIAICIGFFTYWLLIGYQGVGNMRELIHIGNETLQLVETESGYEFRTFPGNTIHEICNHGELNETIYSMIDKICTAMV